MKIKINTKNNKNLWVRNYESIQYTSMWERVTRVLTATAPRWAKSFIDEAEAQDFVSSFNYKINNGKFSDLNPLFAEIIY